MYVHYHISLSIYIYINMHKYYSQWMLLGVISQHRQSMTTRGFLSISRSYCMVYNTILVCSVIIFDDTTLGFFKTRAVFHHQKHKCSNSSTSSLILWHSAQHFIMIAWLFRLLCVDLKRRFMIAANQNYFGIALTWLDRPCKDSKPYLEPVGK